MYGRILGEIGSYATYFPGDMMTISLPTNSSNADTGFTASFVKQLVFKLKQNNEASQISYFLPQSDFQGEKNRGIITLTLSQSKQYF